MLNFGGSVFIVYENVQNSKELNNLELLNEFMIQTAALHLPIFVLCDINH